MAEFKDVIKQQKRMCDAMNNCGQCPLIDADCACRFSCMFEDDFDLAETEMIERIVMDWAEAPAVDAVPVEAIETAEAVAVAQGDAISRSALMDYLKNREMQARERLFNDEVADVWAAAYEAVKEAEPYVS